MPFSRAVLQHCYHLCCADGRKALQCAEALLGSVELLLAGCCAGADVAGSAARPTDGRGGAAQELDRGRGRVAGSMWAENVPHAKCPVVTFWEGEVVDDANHSFITAKWGARRAPRPAAAWGPERVVRMEMRRALL